MHEPRDPVIRVSDGSVATVPSPEVVAKRAASYESWTSRVAKPVAEGGHGAVITRADPIEWAPLARPLSQCTVALVSTCGVHTRGQEPYDAFSDDGDSSLRVISGDVDSRELTVSHIHYPTDDALEDINVTFPLDRLRELADEGAIGAVSRVHLGMMGFIPDPSRLLTDTVSEGITQLRDAGVDAVVLTGG